MTNAEIIQAIKAEIERRMKILRKDEVVRQNCTSDFLEGKIYGYEELLSFLSTLESEKPVPNDLEEAAGEYEKKHTYQRYDGGGLTPEYDATLAEAFIAGHNLCRNQMMSEAVEGRVFMSFAPGHNQMVMADVDLPTNTKVRVIVLPKED